MSSSLCICPNGADVTILLYIGVTSSERHSSASALGINESEFNATVIVLTTIAAVGLVSFIGVFVGLILLTRRLKTIKAIKGQSYKRSATVRP